MPGTRVGGVSVLGIDGRSGVGKTKLTAAVAEHLQTQGRAVCVLHMDTLYVGWSGLADVGAVLCRDVMTPLRAGRPPQVRRYDWDRGRLEPPSPLPVADVLIVEGVGATVHPCRSAFDAMVWVQAPRGLRLSRARAREDQGDYAAYEKVWERQEVALFGPDRYPEHPAGYDIVVDSGLGRGGDDE